jgi:hypothetical protein
MFCLLLFKLFKTENDSIIINSNEQSISNAELKNEFEQIEIDRLINEETNKNKWKLELQKKEFQSKFFLLFAIVIMIFMLLLKD